MQAKQTAGQVKQAALQGAPSAAHATCRLARWAVRVNAVAPPAGLTYKQAGVDIDAGEELVRRIKKMNPSGCWEAWRSLAMQLQGLITDLSHRTMCFRYEHRLQRLRALWRLIPRVRHRRRGHQAQAGIRPQQA